MNIIPTMTIPPMFCFTISSVSANVKSCTWSSFHSSWLMEVMNLEPTSLKTLAHWSNLFRGILNKNAKLFRHSSLSSCFQQQVNSKSPLLRCFSPVITFLIFSWIKLSSCAFSNLWFSALALIIISIIE